MEYSTDGLNYISFGTTIAYYHSGTISGLSQSQTYYVRVKVSNAAGTSGYSNVYTINPTGGSPATPSNLSASAVDQYGYSTLHWSGSYVLSDKAYMEWSTDGSNFFVYGQTTYATYGVGSVGGLQQNTTYYFRVRVRDAAGVYSGYSNVYQI
jgi:hypothetical protein